MNPTIYSQGDVRWATLPYPKSPWTVKSDGCGLCAVTHCAIELKKYWANTPKDFLSFMRAYATNGNGTEWVGIDKGLEKYLGNYKRHYTMSSLWAELNKGNRVGVILFGGGTAPDGTVWTLGGHYVAFTNYKVENGLHWLYMKDSSYRNNSGWKSYEKSMKGCIPDVMWSAELMKDGWYKTDGDWYYYNNGVMVKSNWQKDSKGWCYLGADGKMVKSQWIKWKDEWYYIDSNGYMVSNGWQKDSKGWCYLNKDGKMVKDAWVRWKNNMYYIKPDGYMQTGKATINCTFNDSGKLEATE